MAGVAAGGAGRGWAAPPPWLLWWLAAAGVVSAVGTVALALSSEIAYPLTRSLLLDWIALPFVIAGLIGWSRRPDSRLGPLMVGAGFSVWLSALAWADTPFLATVGQLTDLLVAALFIHVYLAYPSGRLRRQPERALVHTAYAVAFGLQIPKLLLGDEDATAIALIRDPTAAGVIEGIQIIALLLLCLGAAAVLVVRRRQGPPLHRRPTALLIDAFGIGLVMMAINFVSATLEPPWHQWIQVAMYGVLGLAPIAFLLGLIDSRLALSGVGDLLVRLRSQPTGDLREPLAQALRDPSLTIVYWLPDFSTWADHEGQAVVAPDDTPDRGTALISRDGQPVAALLFDPNLQDEHELIAAVTAAAGIALENDRLQVELRARVQELQESRARMLQAGQVERQRLERNLHDGAQQRLVALSMELGMIEAGLGDDPSTLERVRRARGEVAVSLEELREIARGIYPAVLSSHGLAVAIESLATRSPVPMELAIDLVGVHPTAAVEEAAYYVACETLANIGKHAQATSARIQLGMDGGRMILEVVDDGMGGADTEAGSGLRGLADRVEALGGHLRVWTPPGGGTWVRAELPC